jgi:hypothetical protein
MNSLRMLPSSARKRGDDVGKTKFGKGMKLEIVVDASGLPWAWQQPVPTSLSKTC